MTSTLIASENGSSDCLEKGYTPPASESSYRWRQTLYDTSQKRKQQCWWRNVDAMANFILHWQNRFHQHGDMFLSCLLYCESGPYTHPMEISVTQLREAMRRLRFSHPTMALRLAKRSELCLEPLDLQPFISKRVDLQVALVYDLVKNEVDVEQWLDTTLYVHSEPRPSSEGQQTEFEQHLVSATQPNVAGRDRLIVHFWPADLSRGIAARLLLEQCHSVSEGIGTFILLDELLKSIAGVLQDSACAEYEWGSEVTRLEPSLQDAIAEVPETWTVSAAELKAVKKINAKRMSGKATAPNVVDKIGIKLVAAALRGNDPARSPIRRTVNKPLVVLCRKFAEKGDMYPLGLLPQTGKPFKGKIGHTAIITDNLTAEQTSKLLSVLKANKQTLAPFLEACMHMATTWVRKRHGLTTGDESNRILGSFSNAISKRHTLLPQFQRYMGLCMGGLPTKIAASAAQWSSASTPSNASRDAMPNITATDFATLLSISTDLGAQYIAGRGDPNWLRYDQALMMSTMETEYLFLRDAAHYPSMPWLSSIGRIEPLAQGRYSINDTAALKMKHVRAVGRVGIRQPILHAYTYEMQTILQVSYASWLYPDQDSNNILVYWLSVVKALILHTIAQ